MHLGHVRKTSRRAFLQTAAAAASAAIVPSSAFALPGSSRVEPGSPRGARASHVRLGVASYSLRHFPLEKAIEAVNSLRTPYVNLKSMHLPYELPAAEIAAARHSIESAGLQIVGGGLITFERDSDDDVRRYFDYAKAAGMPLIVATAHPDVLPRVERFAKQYDIKIAIHNHGPEDHHFPSPYEALARVRSMDARMGLCIDIGHTVRTGTDVVRAIADAGSRLLDMHVKDLRDLKNANSQCIVGQGAMPIAAIFRQLDAMQYAGFVNLEYEIDMVDPIPGMQQSFAYMRGVLAGMESASHPNR